MAETLISARLPPDIDPTKARLAFGERALPKLDEELNCKDLYTQQKALSALSDVLHDPEHISKAIKCSIVESLKGLLKSDNEVVRMKTTECQLIISGHAIGRQTLIDVEAIKPIAALFDDVCEEVRLNAHKTIEMLSTSYPGPEAIVECGLVQVLIQKLEQSHNNEIKSTLVISDSQGSNEKVRDNNYNRILSEESENFLLALDTLHRCMRVKPEEALDYNAMAIFTSLLSDDNASIRAKAAMNIKELSFPTQGKDKACEEGTVQVLAKLLSDDDIEVRCQTCAALMVITITTRGKFLALESRVLPRLLELLGECSVELRLNALKVLTTLAEAPKARAELLISLDQIVKLKHDDDSQAIRKAAQIAERTITWKP